MKKVCLRCNAKTKIGDLFDDSDEDFVQNVEVLNEPSLFYYLRKLNVQEDKLTICW